MNNKLIEITRYIYSLTGNKILISYFCVFVASILEIIGLASILPLIKLLLDGGDTNIEINYFQGFFV